MLDSILDRDGLHEIRFPICAVTNLLHIEYENLLHIQYETANDRWDMGYGKAPKKLAPLVEQFYRDPPSLRTLFIPFLGHKKAQ